MAREISDVCGSSDCFLRVVFHQLYGKPNYHMNVRSTGVQYIANNPERFIKSSTDHSWPRYLANMSHQGTGLIHMLYKNGASYSFTT